MVSQFAALPQKLDRSAALTIRMPTALKVAISNLAVSQYRSASAVALMALEDYAARHGTQSGRPEATGASATRAELESEIASH